MASAINTHTNDLIVFMPDLVTPNPLSWPPVHSARKPVFLRTEIRMEWPVAIAILFCSSLARPSWGRSATTGRHFSFIPFQNKGLIWSATNG
jgi:hypothetical protein